MYQSLGKLSHLFVKELGDVHIGTYKYVAGNTETYLSQALQTNKEQLSKLHTGEGLISLVNGAMDATKLSRPDTSKLRVGSNYLARNTDGRSDTFPFGNIEQKQSLNSCCAETGSVTCAVSRGYDRGTAMAVTAHGLPDEIFPCGICRSWIEDHTGGELLLLLGNSDFSKIHITTPAGLHPGYFPAINKHLSSSSISSPLPGSKELTKEGIGIRNFDTHYKDYLIKNTVVEQKMFTVDELKKDEILHFDAGNELHTGEVYENLHKIKNEYQEYIPEITKNTKKDFKTISAIQGVDGLFSRSPEEGASYAASTQSFERVRSIYGNCRGMESVYHMTPAHISPSQPTIGMDGKSRQQLFEFIGEHPDIPFIHTTIHKDGTIGDTRITTGRSQVPYGFSKESFME